jgi:hypothetical protein
MTVAGFDDALATSVRGMATIRDKAGHIAARDSSRTSYKPAFCDGAIAEEKFEPPFMVSKWLKWKTHRDAPRAGLPAKSQMAHFVANRCHIPSGSASV